MAVTNSSYKHEHLCKSGWKWSLFFKESLVKVISRKRVFLIFTEKREQLIAGRVLAERTAITDKQNLALCSGDGNIETP